MFDKEKLTGANINIEYCGIKLQSPFILASGPLTYSAQGMVRAHNAGCGAVVSKTIRLGAAINPVHHMGKLANDSIINCEKWADNDREEWYTKEIPQAKAAGAVVIGSVGHTPKEAQAIVKDVQKAGADIIELVSYTEETLLPMLDYAKANVDIPVICKLSGNWPDAPATAKKCYEHGADGIAAIDSIGPTLKIDINKRAPLMESGDGYGWTTGAFIKPISMRINADITRNLAYKNLYGMGGVMNAADAIEYLMVGCNAVGICTVGILKGIGYIEKMCYDLSTKLKALGFASLQEAIGVALPNFPKKENITEIDFSFDESKCTKCKKCELVCCYEARKLDFPEMSLQRSACRSCGLCVDYCPTGALTGKNFPQNEKYIQMAKKSANFDEMVNS